MKKRMLVLATAKAEELTHLWTKFVVPSMGSMIHVGLSVRILGAPADTDSSPIKLTGGIREQAGRRGLTHTTSSSYLYIIQSLHRSPAYL